MKKLFLISSLALVVSPAVFAFGLDYEALGVPHPQNFENRIEWVKSLTSGQIQTVTEAKEQAHEAKREAMESFREQLQNASSDEERQSLLQAHRAEYEAKREARKAKKEERRAKHEAKLEAYKDLSNEERQAQKEARRAAVESLTDEQKALLGGGKKGARFGFGRKKGFRRGFSPRKNFRQGEAHEGENRFRSARRFGRFGNRGFGRPGLGAPQIEQ